ncbi:MAG: DotA/TraY family protein [Alphaproteobacteria bacterium]|nr:DotA/TraY family protein [Alphaproteobacteria bacterium]
MSGIQTKTIVKYTLLPGIIPRISALFSSGFAYVAFLMAQIYGMVRLLPPGHPYLNPKNTGRYGIRHVIAESANSIVISKRNIDQIVIFVLMLTAITLLALQLGTLVLSLLFGPAMAVSIFETTNPDNDIAFMLLDQVFGVGDGTVANNFFNSCVANTGIACQDQPASIPFPWPFHIALQNLFRFYSLAILIIGTLIFLYFVLVVVVETAATGAPFGQRFQNVWAPIRLVVAIGLLIPLQFGYNSGQYITFAAAKYGSGLATQSWLRYNNAIAGRLGAKANPLGEAENLIAAPAYPDAAPMVMAMSMVHACAFATYFADEEIKKQAATPGPPGSDPPPPEVTIPEDSGAYSSYISAADNPRGVRPYLVKSPQAWQTATSPDTFEEVTDFAPGSGTDYNTALNFYSGGDIVIRFGRKGDLDWNRDGDTADDVASDRFKDEPGRVEPTCGEIRIPISDRRQTPTSNVHATDGFLGAVAMQRFYYNLVRAHWHDFSVAENYVDFGGRMSMLNGGTYTRTEEWNPCAIGCSPANALLVEGPHECSAGLPDPDNRQCSKQQPSVRWRQDAINTMQTTINTQMDDVWVQYNTDTNEFDMDPLILDRGWGGAGIWFNRLAQVNGAFVESQLNFPSYDLMPKVMQSVSEQKKQKDNDSASCEAFNPNASPDSGQIVFPVVTDRRVALILYRVGCYWTEKGDVNEAKPDKGLDSNILKQGMNLVFGTYGLFAMTERNANIHPLAQLVTMGKGLVEATVRNIAGSTLFAVGGGLAAALGAQGGSGLGDTASGFLSSTAFIGLTAGVVLYYILPFLPFVYFYFAVASWIKTIFEAMVGVPLWALAHLRLDGDGLPGESAANGYFLIFEIFVRPVLSVAGLIAAMIIFTAQVRVLNYIWMLVTENVGGHHGDPSIGIAGKLEFKRGIIDEFFYTIVYAIICYMMATTAFKLIDKIPDNILRWMGQGVSSFGDINQDPTESLTKYAALGGLTAGQQVVGGINTAGKGLGQAIAAGRAGSGGSDRHLKENIEYLGLENGIPIYAFNYIGEPERYKGVMAQDILAIMPEAVFMMNGYLAVDYDKIGIKMERLDTTVAGGRTA